MTRPILTLAFSLILTSSAALACGEDHAAGDKSASSKGGHSFSLVSNAQANEAPAAATADIKKATFKVDKMMCSGCQSKVEAKLKTIDGFQSVTFKKKQAEVTYLASKTNEKTLHAAINEAFADH